jgi:hypothetical protein
VEAARKDLELQEEHPATEIQYYLTVAKPCPKCHTTPDQLTWFYFKARPGLGVSTFAVALAGSPYVTPATSKSITSKKS